MANDKPRVPLGVRVRLGHAAVQSVVEATGSRALHLKGYALHPSLAWPGRVGSDVDLLVHPDDVPRVLCGLAEAGWRHYTGFETGSAFGHAATLTHDDFGYVDVHRFFPGVGIDAAAAFEMLWADRDTVEIAGRACPVPAPDAQALVLLLHAGRSTGSRAAHDVAHAWTDASGQRRAAVLALVGRLDAQVGFSAAVGGLDAFADRADYELWRVSVQGGTRLEEWRARLIAAPSLGARIRLLLRAPLVNTEHLAALLHRPPTRREVVAEFFGRIRRALEELDRLRRRPR